MNRKARVLKETDWLVLTELPPRNDLQDRKCGTEADTYEIMFSFNPAESEFESPTLATGQ